MSRLNSGGEPAGRRRFHLHAVRPLTMATFTRSLVLSAALTAAFSLMLIPAQTSPSSAQSCDGPCSTPSPSPSPSLSPSPRPSPSPSPSPSHTSTSTPTPNPTPTPTSTPTPVTSPSPTPTGSASSGASITDRAKHRFNQMTTNRVLGDVLLGVNEQINCSDCVSAFGSAGSFSAGTRGRKSLTANLSLLAGIPYTQYNEGGYSGNSAPVRALALRYGFLDVGPSRPLFAIWRAL